MAKVTPTSNKRKLTAAGFESCAESLQNSHPKIASILQDKIKLDELELILRAHTTHKLIEQLERITEAKLLPRDAFEDLGKLDLATRYELVAADHLDMNPVGTAEWVFEVFPDAKAHFCRLLIDAGEAEETLRELTVNYNYTGLDADEIPSLLGFINDFCKVLRPLARIQEKRANAIAHVEVITKPRRQLEPSHSPQRA